MSLGDFRSIYMPYCMRKQDDGSYIVLNREYKPLGFNTTAHINYEDFPVSTVFKGLGPSIVKKLSYEGSDNADCIFLYDDCSVPTQNSEHMDAYLKRLNILAKLKIA